MPPRPERAARRLLGDDGLVPTQPPGVTQQLVIRSLERALAGLYVHRFEGRSVDVAVFAHAGNEAFVNEFVMSWLKAHGVRTVSTNPDCG